MKEQHTNELATVTFLPLGKTFEVQTGQSILDVALDNDVPLDHACGGVCACSTCHVIIKKGMELLSEMEDDEADQLDEAAGLTLQSRLGCQALIQQPGNLVVEIPSWNRNYAREGE
ncbi:MAG: 2Fe-2S iron-sulfur cluster-binding protein [Acidobacteriota bacterium]|nr:2Fe-2S iron-sulfur cluster-binding protein [Blastocatellia bacterium]MDW8413273.1 2Fe-2S iron-sulfur cluster-binding protein [Acidobacteriota bacterium]